MSQDHAPFKFKNTQNKLSFEWTRGQNTIKYANIYFSGHSATQLRFGCVKTGQRAHYKPLLNYIPSCSLLLRVCIEGLKWHPSSCEFFLCTKDCCFEIKNSQWVLGGAGVVVQLSAVQWKQQIWLQESSGHCISLEGAAGGFFARHWKLLFSLLYSL